MSQVLWGLVSWPEGFARGAMCGYEQERGKVGFFFFRKVTLAVVEMVYSSE